MTHHTLLCLAIAGWVFVAGCDNAQRAKDEVSAASGWSAIDENEALDRVLGQRSDAEEARAALFSRLMAELSAAMEKGGPAAGIEICADRASAIAAEVSASHGVVIGRTSYRLRNPANRPPAWAMDAVRRRTDKPISFVHKDGRFATLKPIFLATNCLVCHGAPDQLAPGVPDMLAAQYPRDEATGFSPGDLRGWFWIEVPKADDDG